MATITSKVCSQTYLTYQETFDDPHIAWTGQSDNLAMMRIHLRITTHQLFSSPNMTLSLRSSYCLNQRIYVAISLGLSPQCSGSHRPCRGQPWLKMPWVSIDDRGFGGIFFFSSLSVASLVSDLVVLGSKILATTSRCKDFKPLNVLGLQSVVQF